jgi:CubicO group peptidase (beta-lactamase class C family)
MFADALRGGKLVSRATFEKMTQPHGQMPGGQRYGYGMMIEDVYGRRIVGAWRRIPWRSSELYIVLDSPYTAVVLANQDPPAAEMARRMAEALVAEEAKAPH